MKLIARKTLVRLAAVLGMSFIPVLAAVWFTSSVHSQGHGSRAAGVSLSPQEVLTSVAHGITQAAVSFLAGLVAFVVLVWRPVSRAEDAEGEKAIGLFLCWMWIFFGLLVVAVLVEISLYAVRASGESLSPGLLVEVLFDTRLGHLWIFRLAFGLLTAAAATYYAAREPNPACW